MINKRVLKYWSLCSLLLVIGIHYFDGMPEIDDWPMTIAGILFGVFFLIVISIILSVIIAAFPFNSNTTPGKQKIRSFIPICTVLLTVASFIAFIITRPSYASEVPAERTLCQRVKEGKFRLDQYIIERKGDVQIETDVTTKEKIAYKVKWINDCEFELISFKDSIDRNKVKIIAVTEHGYECVLQNESRSTKHELLIIMNGN